jgi:hypothetical protein
MFCNINKHIQAYLKKQSFSLYCRPEPFTDFPKENDYAKTKNILMKGLPIIFIVGSLLTIHIKTMKMPSSMDIRIINHLRIKPFTRIKKALSQK